MATNKKFGDLVRQGRENSDDREYDEDGAEVRFAPPAGWRGRCQVELATYSAAKDGAPTWGVKLKIVEPGEFKDKTFWINIRYSMTWDFMNDEANRALEALGLDMEWFSEQEGDAGGKMVASALAGLRVILIAGYKPKDKNDPDGEQWDAHRYVAAKAEKKARPTKRKPKAAAKEEDEEEEKPVAKKATRRKAKPKPEPEPEPEEEEEEFDGVEVDFDEEELDFDEEMDDSEYDTE